MIASVSPKHAASIKDMGAYVLSKCRPYSNSLFKMGVEINQSFECIWHEIRPGVVQRSMTPLECFFTPDLSWSVWSSIKLGSVPNACDSDEVLINQLRRAWIRVLYEQPQLRHSLLKRTHKIPLQLGTDRSCALKNLLGGFLFVHRITTSTESASFCC